MGTAFQKDMNIITNFLRDMDIIAALDDQPNDVGGLTAAELKAKFDEGGKAIQEYINHTLIPEVLGLDATEAARELAEKIRQANEQARQLAEQERVDVTTGIVAQATMQANRAQAEADRASVPAVKGVYNVILSDRITGQRYALTVENGILHLLGTANTLDATECTLIDSSTGVARRLTVESGILKLEVV